jgi:hypothetical protein
MQVAFYEGTARRAPTEKHSLKISYKHIYLENSFQEVENLTIPMAFADG